MYKKGAPLGFHHKPVVMRKTRATRNNEGVRKFVAQAKCVGVDSIAWKTHTHTLKKRGGKKAESVAMGEFLPASTGNAREQSIGGFVFGVFDLTVFSKPQFFPLFFPFFFFSVVFFGVDMSDGVFLFYICSALSKKNPGRLKTGSNLSRFEKLANANTVLSFLQLHGIKLTNIGADDIVQGNSKLIQGLIWSMLTFFLVEADVGGDDFDSAAIPTQANGKELTPKQKVLEWVKFVTNNYPGVKVTNWQSFDDGLALCAIVHFHYPRVLDFYALDPNDKLANIQTALACLEKRWGIPALVDAADLMNGRADEEMLLGLVAMCKKELKNPPMDSTAMSSDRYVASSPSVARKMTRESSQTASGGGTSEFLQPLLFPLSASRDLLRRVLEAAEQEKRVEMDSLLAQVLKRFRGLIQELEDALVSATVVRQSQLRACRADMDRGLRDLMEDSVMLCGNATLPVAKQLMHRDITTLCASEADATVLLKDDTDGTRKVLNERMRAMRSQVEPEQLRLNSKLLQEEHLRLASSARLKVDDRASRLQPERVKVALQMVAELDALSPRFEPLALRLVRDPGNMGAQRELAELNREITNTMAELELTLELDASKELQMLNRAISDAFVRFRMQSLEGCKTGAHQVSNKAQTALSATRATCQSLPKAQAKPLLVATDRLDGALSQLQKAIGTATSTPALETHVQTLKNAAEDLAELLQKAETQYRQASGVPQVKDAVTGVLVAIRHGDKVGMRNKSAELCVAAERALSIARDHKAHSSNPDLVEDFIRDLQELQPLHRQATQVAASMDHADRPSLRRVAETARDMLSVVLDLDDVSQPAEDDEFSSLQALVSGSVDLLASGFDLVHDTRDVAQSAREAALANPVREESLDVLATIQELEAAVPSIVVAADTDEGRAEAQQNKEVMVRKLPKLEKAVKKHKKEKAIERTNDPQDDLVRLARYARAGVGQERIAEVQQGVKKKKDGFIKKNKAKAMKVEDPIRQQRIMQSLQELEDMAPLQMEAFSGMIEEPGTQLDMGDEFADLSSLLSDGTREVEALFPDLLMATPMDLDSAIKSLEREVRGPHDQGPVLRTVDMETLSQTGPIPMVMAAPQMLTLASLETPVMDRKGTRKKAPKFDADQLAQEPAEALAESDDEDNTLLDVKGLTEELESLLAAVRDLCATMEAGPPLASLEDGHWITGVVRDVCALIRQGKLIGAGMGDGDSEASSVMFAELENLANNSAALVFAIRSFGEDASKEEEVDEACAMVAHNGQQLEQLVTSRCALLAVADFDLGTGVSDAEASLASVHARLDHVWREEIVEPMAVTPPKRSLETVKLLAEEAQVKWEWEDFVRATEVLLRQLKAVLPKIQDASSRVVLHQDAESLLGRAKLLLSASVHQQENASLVLPRRELQDAVVALQRGCDALTARSFRAVRTLENTPDAAAIQAAVMEGLATSPDASDLLPRVKQVQEAIPALSGELRAFKANPDKFSVALYRGMVCGLLANTGVLCAGFEDADTKNLLQGLRTQLADTGSAFLFTVLDVLEYPGDETFAQSMTSLKAFSLVLMQLQKWTNKATSQLQPSRNVLTDPDTSRILRRLKALRESEQAYVAPKKEELRRLDFGPIRGLVTGLWDALVGAQGALQELEDTSVIGDAVVHVVLQVGSLARHYGIDAQVGQMCALAELFGHSVCDVIFCMRDLKLPIGSLAMVHKAADISLEAVQRMTEKCRALSDRLIVLMELQRLTSQLEACEATLADESLVSPPRAQSAVEFERVLKRETSQVIAQCARPLDHGFDFQSLGNAVLGTAAAVRNNAAVITDGGDVAKIVRMTATTIGCAVRALVEHVGCAGFDPSSEAFHMGQVRVAEELKSVKLLAEQLEELVVRAVSFSSTVKERVPRKRGSSSGSASPDMRPAANNKEESLSSIPPAGQTLLVGKALTNCIVELAKGQTAVFNSSESAPSNLAGSLTMLPSAEERIDGLLSRGAGPELQRALIFFMNILKHLASGYCKNDPTKLSELVACTKTWAAKVILCMKEFETTSKCSPGPAREALKDLHKLVTTKVVLCCGSCHKAISGTYTTADGISFHDTCFKCFTCQRPIVGSYFRDGDHIYCSDDLPMTNNLVCTRCNESVEYGSNYLECRNLIFHRECFTCYDCDKPLSSTRFYVLRDEVRCEEHAL